MFRDLFIIFIWIDVLIRHCFFFIFKYMGSSYLLSLSYIFNMRNLRNVILRFTDSFHVIVKCFSMFWHLIDLFLMCICLGSSLDFWLIFGYLGVFLFQLSKFLVKTLLGRRLRCIISYTLVFVPEIWEITINDEFWSFTHRRWICWLRGLVSCSVVIVVVPE